MKKMTLILALIASLCLPALAQKETDAQKGKRLRAEYCESKAAWRVMNTDSDVAYASGTPPPKVAKRYTPAYKAKKIKKGRR